MSDFDSLCRMPAFLGLLELQKARRGIPNASDAERVNVLRSNYATASLDYDAATALENIVGAPEDGSFELSLRIVLRKVILHFRPAWLVVVPEGRQLVAQATSRDTFQCLRVAGLYDAPAAPDAVAWWDDLASVARAASDAGKTTKGREGERLSFEREVRRLRELGIAAEPKWVSLDNNRLGYDILSYDIDARGTYSKLIEVKATTASPPRFFLTRTEWERAMASRAAYVLHLWVLPEARLTEFRTEDLLNHIPSDQGRGRWDLVHIAF
jgi:hypothetical protein